MFGFFKRRYDGANALEALRAEKNAAIADLARKLDLWIDAAVELERRHREDVVRLTAERDESRADVASLEAQLEVAKDVIAELNRTVGELKLDRQASRHRDIPQRCSREPIESWADLKWE